MEPNEVVVLKVYALYLYFSDDFLIRCDADGSIANFAAHTAFYDPSMPECSPLRQSIELRTLVFYD
jgi:hypothetical protein